MKLERIAFSGSFATACSHVLVHVYCIESMVASFNFFSSFLLSSFLLSLLPLHSSKQDLHYQPSCKPTTCGVLQHIDFPFANLSQPECGIYTINCTKNISTIRFEEKGKLYVVKSISYEANTIVVQDDQIARDSSSNICNSLYNFTLPPSKSLSFRLTTPNYTFLNCKRSHLCEDCHGFFNYSCEDSDLYYKASNQSSAPRYHNCSLVTYPTSEWLVDPYRSKKDLITVLAAGFALQWNLSRECSDCNKKRGECGWNHTTEDFLCLNPGERHKSKRALFIGLSAGLGGGFLLVVLFGLLYWRHRKKHNPSSSNLLSRNLSSDPYSKSELEKGIQTQIFSYKELEEATNNFDPSKELGDGGFGAVYHGKLRDGRVVAIKRLYDNNYKRVEQFKNEIDILSRLRHKNLVSLYGCSTRHSRELLLVYEFIPNGTVAGHLHGDRVKPGVLTWPIRLSIAIETADALAYLHKVDVIHRDVKTDNILLDNNFCVKVADFGLSRLFPTDVTHVSTAPQGTPGYVDPDYHKCYQLTDKSDVYSFGVVLVELISSMPAVDISRHRHEINLANMAINKIHSDSLHELVDSTLGFDSDFHVRRMITMVAELAFRCLQDEKDVRPSMEEVLEVLRSIENGEDKVQKTEEVVTPAADEVALLKKIPPLSPDAVTDAWVSRTSTPNTSG